MSSQCLSIVYSLCIIEGSKVEVFSQSKLYILTIEPKL